MFRNAIKKGLQYIRPLITGKLIYKDKNIVNSLSTLIVLNKNGDILTTLTNAELFLIEDDNNEVFIRTMGLSLPKVENYFPSKTVRVGSEIDMLHENCANVKFENVTTLFCFEKFDVYLTYTSDYVPTKGWRKSAFFVPSCFNTLIR